jgi:Spy/CpxP family protein refolding chaperone
MNDFTDSPSTAPLPNIDTPRRRWTVVVMAIVIFLAGMASGAAVTVVYAVNRLQYAIQHPEVAPARIATNLARRLDLTNEQRDEIEKIMTRRQTEIAAIRRRFQPQIVEQLESVRTDVAAVLDDSQRTEWTQLFERFKQRWLPVLPGEAAKATGG